eukprot:4506250-Ditylum_brightwellii.AAC.1
MQPRPWNNFFKGLIGTCQNLQKRWFGVDSRQHSDGWGFYPLGVKKRWLLVRGCRRGIQGL